MGNTNIVERPTKDQLELSKKEMVDATERLEAKVRRARPEATIILGNSKIKHQSLFEIKT